jgi:hypothetical protein
MIAGSTTILDAKDAGPADQALTEEDFVEAAAIAAKLFPDEVAAADPCTCLEAVLAERIEFSESLHWLANARGDPALHVLADVIAGPALHALVAWQAKYIAYRPFAAYIVGPDPQAAADLRETTVNVLEAEPHSVLELATKIRFACLVGIHARLRRQFPDAGPEAAAAYAHFREHLDRLPNWVLVGVFLRRVRPEWINALDPPPNRDAVLILDAIHDAGPSWEAAIAADVERLRDAGAGDGDVAATFPQKSSNSRVFPQRPATPRECLRQINTAVRTRSPGCFRS